MLIIYRAVQIPNFVFLIFLSKFFLNKALMGCMIYFKYDGTQELTLSACLSVSLLGYEAQTLQMGIKIVL